VAAVVAVAYRQTCDELHRFVRQVRSLHGGPFPIWIVNNDAGRSLHALDQYRDVYVVDAGVNLGWTGGANAGMRMARQSSPRYLLLLNTDVEMCHPDLVLDLAAVLDNQPDVGFVSPGIVLAGSPDRAWYRGTTMAKWTWITRQEGIGELQQWTGEVRDVLVASGCCVMVRPAMVDDTGGFSPELFAYFDEAEWCLRARRSGWRSALLDVPMLAHDTPGRGLTATAAYYFGRNPFVAARMSCPCWQWPLVAIAQCIAAPLYLCRAVDGRARREYARGFRHGMAHLFGVAVHVGEGHDDGHR
jgi:GT2 family glycosyltransferase